jgi:hypothetical protein
VGFWSGFFGTDSERTITPLKSPVAWVSDDIWSRWMDHPSPPERPAIDQPMLVVVTDADRERVRSARLSEGEPAPVAAFSDQEALLLATPFAHYGVSCPTWPVCCSRLATLFWDQGAGPSFEEIERETGPLDRAYLEGELRQSSKPLEEARRLLEPGYQETLGTIREKRHGGDGILLFQCRACFRVYVASCHP